MSEYFIVCENVVKIYKLAELELFALQGLDLNVSRGEMLGIVGASGSGKSTLMNLLGGLDRPSAGRIFVDGKEIFKLSETGLDRYRRQQVGFVWQQGTRNLIPYLTAQENVMLPMQLAGQTVSQARQRAAELLASVKLEERRDHTLANLSGGEQQRVAIAIALVNRPTLLLADEPTGEVDTATARVIYDIFREISRSLSLTTIIVSHDPNIAHHVDRVVGVRDGKLASETLRHALDGDGESHFQELAVLDSAGRLQIPKDYMQHFNIHRRVELELTEDGILIRPAEHAGSEAQLGQSGPAAELISEEQHPLQGLSAAWQRLSRLFSDRRRQ